MKMFQCAGRVTVCIGDGTRPQLVHSVSNSTADSVPISNNGANSVYMLQMAVLISYCSYFLCVYY